MALPSMTSPSVLGGMPDPMASLQKNPVLPKEMNYMHNNFSPEIFTGKTTSQKIASGEIKSKQTNENIFAKKKDPEFFLNSEPAKNAIGALKDTAEMYHNKAQDISKWGQDVAKNPGLEALGGSVKDTYPGSYDGIDDTELGKMMLEKHPEYQSYVDSKAGVMGTAAKMIGGVGSTFMSAPGMIAEGAANIGEGEGKIAQGKYAEGATQTALGGVQGMFGVSTPAMPIATSVIGGISGTDLGGKVLGGITNFGGQAFEKGAELLGADEATQNYTKQLGENLAPLILTKTLSEGGKYIAPKVMPTVNKVGGKMGEMAKNIAPSITETVSSIPSKVKNVGEHISSLGTKGRDAISGLSDAEISALKSTPINEYKSILDNAKQAVVDDYAQTPYHAGAEKANTAFSQMERKLETAQKERLQTIENSGVKTIDTKNLRGSIVKDLQDTFNIEKVDTDSKGNVTITPKKGRESLIDEGNVKDIEAMKMLERLTQEKSPMEMMDTVKKLQQFVYDNTGPLSPLKLSDDMASLVKRATGKINENLKNQLPKEYRELVEQMSKDIKIKNDLKRVFSAGEPGQVGNRGELAMKRLSKGTTTSGEVRELAIRIKEATGIDLIKEARLRQLAMDIAGDKRASDLFGSIGAGKQGIIDYTLRKAIEATPFSKEKTSIARTNKNKAMPNSVTK